MSKLKGILLWVVMLSLLLSLVIWIPFKPWLEQREAGEDIIEDEMDSEKALDDYRWFRQQYNDIQAQRNQIENHYDEEEQFHETYGKDPEQWSRTAETRHGRIHTRITGSSNQLERMVSEYNARSQDATSAVWKCHLPYQVDERFAVAGPPGSGSPDQPQDKYHEDADPNKEPPQAQECDALPKQATADS